MKLIQSAAIGVCLFTSIFVQAQQTNKDSVQKSESKKEEYKSKEWHQGNEVMTDTTKRSGEKSSDWRVGKRVRKSRPAPPPPPPPPPAKP